ncbi:MAG: hypothetical protein P6H82_00125 [Candidatus Arsenophonus melophagi]|nr:hypothetical protein [Candidatus Arsenophonus melophagi]
MHEPYPPTAKYDKNCCDTMNLRSFTRSDVGFQPYNYTTNNSSRLQKLIQQFISAIELTIAAVLSSELYLEKSSDTE